MIGKIKWYNPEKAFGFIKTNEGKNYFLHKSEFDGDHTKLVLMLMSSLSLLRLKRLISCPGERSRN
ncbi:cold shock domain-containing protein [Pseudoalteromonas espejiana]